MTDFMLCELSTRGILVRRVGVTSVIGVDNNGSAGNVGSCGSGFMAGWSGGRGRDFEMMGAGKTSDVRSSYRSASSVGLRTTGAPLLEKTMDGVGGRT